VRCTNNPMMPIAHTMTGLEGRSVITDAALRRIRNVPTRKSLDWRWLFRPPMGAALCATLAAGLIAGFYAGPVLHRSAQEMGPLAVTALLDGEEELL